MRLPEFIGVDLLNDRSYMSPEHYCNTLTMRSDLYSAGAIIYFMATGKDPSYPGNRIVLDDTSVSPELSAIIARATAFEPSARFEDTEDMFNALKRLRGDEDDREEGNPYVSSFAK